MKPFFGNFRNRLIAAAFVVGGTIGVSAHADVLNIPASAGMMSVNPPGMCNSLGFYLGVGPMDPTSPNEYCSFEIPISIPAGRTIQQINVVHGTFSYFSYPSIDAALYSLDLISPGLWNGLFPWYSTSYVPDGTYESTHLMSQFGKNFPDAFTTQPNTMYAVRFVVSGAAYVTGLQVIYQ